MSDGFMKVPSSALELLTNKGDRERPFLDTIWGQLFGSVAGFGVFAFVNLGNGRPLLAGIHRHVLGAICGGYGGYIAYQWRADYLATKDAQLRHYVELHPEYFPMPERKKYSEVLEEWVPVR